MATRMTRRRTYLVREVARLSGVTVRTLHHYDAIGLLVPQARSEAGYRVYGEKDLLRLQQVLLGRELGLALEDIRRSLDDSGFDHRQTLVDQRRHLEARALRTDGMIRDEHAAIYADAVAALRAGIAADAPEAMDIAERHRDSIGRWFYPCNLDMHANLADMWESDPRFAESIGKHGTGLTPYLAAAVRANARRQEA